MSSRHRLLGSIAFLGAIGCRGETPSAEAKASQLSLTSLETLPTPAGPGSAEPNLAVTSDGRVLLSWLEPTPDSGHDFRYAQLNGRVWTPPRTITRGKSFFANWADFPSMHVLPRGRLAAHWLQRSSSGKYSYDVRVALSSDSGRTWNRIVTPHRDVSASEHGFVSMWNAGDTLAAAWLDGRKYARIPVQEEQYAKEMMLLSTTIAPNGTRGVERRIDERTCDCCQTSVAITARGPLIAYRDRTTDEIRDIYVSRFERTYWTPPKRVHADDWKVDFCPVNGPAVAARGERAAVAWFTAARDTAKVLVALSNDAGDSFGRPVRIDGGSPAGRVGATMTADGGLVVSWIERTGGSEGAEVRMRRVRADGTVEAPIAIASSSAARASGFPRILSVGDTLVVAWTEPGTKSMVRVARALVRRTGE
jgi:hypothetical protein